MSQDETNVRDQVKTPKTRLTTVLLALRSSLTWQPRRLLLPICLVFGHDYWRTSRTSDQNPYEVPFKCRRCGDILDPQAKT